ncbi:MAG: PLP-dependent cysteine synthase family protein [bacterium]|nr:PLP-dependent cysteine synthase family protein [bacterium]
MMHNERNKRIIGLECLVGNTPLLVINFTYHGRKRTLYAKAENLNMTGSIKDRMALHIFRKGYRTKTLKPGDHIVEATSGNTGISVAAIGRALGHPVTIFMPDWMSKERIKLIWSLGATIRLVSKEEGGFLAGIEMAEELARSSDDFFLPRQFSNVDNIEAHYLTTGPEIWRQLRFHMLRPDAFVAGVGTGGTVMGTGKFLRERRHKIKLHPLEPSNSPTLSTGHKVGKHRIQGISDDFIPDIIDFKQLDRIISVDDGDSILMAQKLARQLGIGVGISSGANFLGGLEILNRMEAEGNLNEHSVVVTVFPDDNKKYLSTDLLGNESPNECCLSKDVQLENFHVFERVSRID